MFVRGEKKKRMIGVALAMSFAAALVAWVGWLVFWPAADRRMVIVPALQVARPLTTGGIQHKAVDLPVALLFDCYENALENVPPRTDTSKRQWSWEAPPLPMDVARAELTKTGGTENDRKVLAWLEDWEEGWRKDYPTTTNQLWRLEPALMETRMSFEALFRIGLAMSFLDGDEQAVCWMRAGLAKASLEFTPVYAVGPQENQLSILLEQTRALWRLKEYGALEQRFALAKRFHAPRSVEWRRSAHLHAEILFYQDRKQEAADEISAVQAAHVEVGDLGRRDNSDLNEMAWVRGLFLYSAERYREAISPLKQVVAAAQPGNRARQASWYLINSLLATGNGSEAQAVYLAYVRQYHPPELQTSAIESAIREAMATVPQPEGIK